MIVYPMIATTRRIMMIALIAFLISARGGDAFTMMKPSSVGISNILMTCNSGLKSSSSSSIPDNEVDNENNENNNNMPIINEQILSSPEEMEEFLNNLAAGLQMEIPDDPIDDLLTRLQSWAGNYDQEAAKQRVQKQIDDHPVLIFGLSDCPYTKEAKEILHEQGVKFMSRDFDTLPDNDEYALRVELAKILDGRTAVPAIFIKGQFIGGLNDGPGIKSIIEDGKLTEMLEG